MAWRSLDEFIESFIRNLKMKLKSSVETGSYSSLHIVLALGLHMSLLTCL